MLHCLKTKSALWPETFYFGFFFAALPANHVANSMNH